MADLVTRLLLNTQGFDNNLQKATQQVQGLQNIGSKITGTLGKFAAAVGAVNTASEAFNRVIRGSQTTSDAYDKVMRSAKNTVDSFFTALSTGDFTTFNMGLSRMIDKAREAQGVIDQLGNTTMSYGYFTGLNQSELATQLNIAKNLTLTTAARNTAKSAAEDIINRQEGITDVLNKTIEDALKAIMTENNSLSMSDVSIKDFEDILMLDILAAGKDAKFRLEKEYEEYTKIYEKIRFNNLKVTANGSGIWISDWDAIEKQMKPINEQYRQAILYNEVLVKMTDDQLKYLIQTAQSLNSSKKTLAEMKNQYQELSNQSVKKVEEPIKPDIGSIAYLDDKLKSLANMYNMATNQQSRNQLMKEIEGITKEKHYIELEYVMSKPLQEQKVSFAKALPEKDKIVFKREDVKVNNDFANSLNNIATVMGSVTNMTNEGAAAWLTWTANLLNGLAAAIPAIQTMITAKTAEAAASGAAEAAKTPFVGWLMVGGAIASILAAFAALPKFAAGGIFAGNSTVGDMNLARVNAGEMILNNRQQKNLFNLLNGNGTLSNGSGQVEFKIKGKELVGVLNNYNNQKNKVR